ncbi:MAG: TlpA family protein disulfide reductase [Terriglobia bacterium]
MIRHKLISALFIFTFALPVIVRGADNLVLNPRLNYKKNNHQGPLITGDHMMDSVKPGMVNYITFYAEFCYNAKRQARTTVDLYNKYKGQVHFVIVDFEYGWSPAQDKLVRQYFMGDGNRNIPQTVILDSKGRPVFDYIGQTSEALLEGWLNAALEYPSVLPVVSGSMDTPREVRDNASTASAR